jgi:diguanylate cyclase (GGDEF)-like protein
MLLKHLLRKKNLDSLTGLSNERGINHKLYELMTDLLQQDSNRDKVLMVKMDVKFFKAFNDLLGWDYGDEHLKTVARSLLDIYFPWKIRSEDDFGRLGGDDFVMIMRLPSTLFADSNDPVLNIIKRIIFDSNNISKDTSKVVTGLLEADQNIQTNEFILATRKSDIVSRDTVAEMWEEYLPGCLSIGAKVFEFDNEDIFSFMRYWEDEFMKGNDNPGLWKTFFDIRLAPLLTKAKNINDAGSRACYVDLNGNSHVFTNSSIYQHQ